MTYQYYIIHKPYGMLCQFTKEGEHKTLADLNYSFQKDIYPVGRLDTDSEGLLILTNDKSLNHALLHPKFMHQRTYCVQVDGLFTDEAKIKLEKGVMITVDGKPYSTLPCKASRASNQNPDFLFLPRNPPIRARKNIPTSWIEITLFEGKNRQVRKMTAAVGYPTLRLIRTSIEGIGLGSLQSNEVRKIEREEMYKKLKL